MRKVTGQSMTKTVRKVRTSAARFKKRGADYRAALTKLRESVDAERRKFIAIIAAAQDKLISAGARMQLRALAADAARAKFEHLEGADLASASERPSSDVVQLERDLLEALELFESGATDAFDSAGHSIVELVAEI